MLVAPVASMPSARCHYEQFCFGDTEQFGSYFVPVDVRDVYTLQSQIFTLVKPAPDYMTLRSGVFRGRSPFYLRLRCRRSPLLRTLAYPPAGVHPEPFVGNCLWRSRGPETTSGGVTYAFCVSRPRFHRECNLLFDVRDVYALEPRSSRW